MLRFFGLLSGAVLLLGSSTAVAQCPSPNPNLTAPPFVDGCPLPAASLNKLVSDQARIANCVGDGVADDTACVQAALTAGGVIRLGPHKYKITSGLTATSTITLLGISNGGGPYDTSCKYGLIAGAANLNLLTLTANNSIIYYACFQMAASGGKNSSGAAIVLQGTSETLIDHAQINFACDGIDVSGVPGRAQDNSSTIRGTTFAGNTGVGCAAMRIGQNTTGRQTVDTKIYDSEVDCDAFGGPPLTSTADGLVIYDVGGTYVSHTDIYGCHYGTKIYPGANQGTQVQFDNTVLGDSSNTADLYINTTDSSASIDSILFSGTWSSDVSSGTSIIIRNDGGGAVTGLHFVGHRTFMTQHSAGGIDIEGALSDLTIDASAVCLAGGSNSNFGIKLGVSTTTGVSIRNTRVGTCDYNPSGSLATGLSIATGSSRSGTYMITGNNFDGTTIPISWSPNAEDASVHDNMGIDNAFATVSSGSTITLPVNSFVKLSGTTAIATINGMWSNRVVTLIPTESGLLFKTGGNLCTAYSSTRNVQLTAIWDNASTCWHLH